MGRRVELRVVGGFEGPAAREPSSHRPAQTHSQQRPQPHARAHAQAHAHRHAQQSRRPAPQPQRHAQPRRDDAQPVPLPAQEPVPGYRPLTSHAAPARVPALLSGKSYGRR
jgi:hypothetical protein